MVGFVRTVVKREERRKKWKRSGCFRAGWMVVVVVVEARRERSKSESEWVKRVEGSESSSKERAVNEPTKKNYISSSNSSGVNESRYSTVVQLYEYGGRR